MLSHGFNTAGNPPDADHPNGVNASLPSENHVRTLSATSTDSPQQHFPSPPALERVESLSRRDQSTARMTRSLELNANSVTGSPKRTPPPLIAPKSVPLQTLQPRRAENAYTAATAIMPIKNESILDYQLDEKALPKNTFHTVRRAINIKHPDELIVSYLKENAPDSYLSELEAVACAFYRFLAPDQVTNTRATYDDKQNYRGVLSDEIPDFKPVSVDPLREEDLDVDHIPETLYAVLDDYDHPLRILEKKHERIERRLKKLDDTEKKCRARHEQLRLARASEKPGELAALAEQFASMAARKDKCFAEACDITREQHELFADLLKKHNISKPEFEHYRMIKGLAIGLTCSYIYAEDDLHQNNIRKDGMRIDFDMSLWPILYEHKNMGFLDYMVRTPNTNALLVTKYDLLHFPNIKDVTPYYWPTNTPQKVAETLREQLSKIVSVSTNAYPSQVNEIYQRLETNKVFRYHYFATLLKFISTQSDMYTNILIQYMDKDRCLQGRSIVEDMGGFMSRRIQSFRDRLLSLSEFAAFVKAHGEAVSKRFIAQFEAENQVNAEILKQLNQEIKDLESGSDNLRMINASLLSRSPKPPSPGLAEDESKQEASKPFKLSIDLNYLGAGEDASAEQKLAAEKIQQERDKEIMQRDMIIKNEKQIEKMAKVLDRKRAIRDDYALQHIKTQHVQALYANAEERLKSLPATLEATQETPRSLPRSASGSTGIRTVAEPEAPAVTAAPSTGGLFSTIMNLGFATTKPSPSQTESRRPPQPYDYSVVKAAVVKAMNDYKEPGFTSFGGSRRTQRPLADTIIGKCDEFAPVAEGHQAHAEAIARIKEFIVMKKGILSSGAMFDALTTLLKHDVWKINEPAVTPRRTTFS